jgi:nucleotide-binding universal stress UspA family protein
MAASQASIGVSPRTVSYKTILLATDFQSTSEAALPYVLTLAHAFDSTVIAVHAVPFEPVTGFAAVPPIGINLEWNDAVEAMKAYQYTHSFHGLRHQCLLERGLPRNVIADVVATRDVDLVVLGTHGRRGLSKVFAGSVAEQVFRTIPCPVLTVGPNVKPLLTDNWQPHHILFATEFAGGSVHALPHALALAQANQAELLIMHTVPLVPWQQRSELAEIYEERLRKLVLEPFEHACAINFTVCFDLPALAILDTALTRNADLIVMGVHHTMLPRVDAHMPGTTACEVITKAHCPVLTVRN